MKGCTLSWIPTTKDDEQAMLETIGVAAIDDLFTTIPDPLRLRDWAIPAGISEMALRDRLAHIGRRNDVGRVSFLGGGYYEHFIPAAVDALTARSEFYTAYTPYQPECAQGTLQSIYEYQSAICRLTEMDYANASLYEGGTAIFEATTMAVRVTGRTRIVCHGSINPVYRTMLETHTAHLELDIVDGDDPEGAACVIVQNPSFLGTLADYTELGARCREAGALLVLSFYPISLGLVKTPGAMGADIAVAEGQSLGIPLGFGGPYLGILATRKAHVRKMPGRLCGETQNGQGRRGFVLTLQAREQHIRREKAMSNICSNQALCALRALIYLCLLGKEGLREVATHCHAKAEYLKAQLSWATLLNDGPTFNEFAIRVPRPADELIERMRERGYYPGLPLAAFTTGGRASRPPFNRGRDPPAPVGDLLIAVTERHTRETLDAFAAALKEESCS
jgi:glycine dehydrogenase subunit 1